MELTNTGDSSSEIDREEIRSDLAPNTTLAKSRKRGGQVCFEKYGAEHYQTMGKRGGEATKQRHDADYYRRIGALGREARRRKKLEIQISSTNEALDVEGIIDAKSSFKE